MPPVMRLRARQEVDLPLPRLPLANVSFLRHQREERTEYCNEPTTRQPKTPLSQVSHPEGVQYTKEKKRDNKRVPPRLHLPSHDGQGCVVCEFREFKWIGLLEQVHCVLGASAPFPSHLPSFSRPTQRHRVLSRPPLVFGNPRGSLTLYLS